MRKWIAGLASITAASALILACGVGSDCDFGLCAAPVSEQDADAGNDGPFDPDARPPGCDGSKEQKAQPACLSDQFAVFVSPLGRPDNPGTKLAPVNTITRALQLVGGARQAIFVCDGSYEERLTIKVPASIYGGLACAGSSWTPSTGRAVIGTPQEPGFALDISAAGAFEIVDIEAVAAPGTSESPNSVTLRAVNTPGLALRRVVLRAGVGAPGAKGDSGIAGTRDPVDGKGRSGSAGAGGMAKTCTCSIGGPTTGGAGGGPSNGGGLAGSGDVVGAPPTDGAGGAGGITNCSTGAGHEGASAPERTPAEPPTSIGQIKGNDWVAANGVSGADGQSGQGGGGGGANGGGGGGGGGCGGCGGGGGKGGKGGGASIAILAINSPLSIGSSELRTASGGRGGQGGTGATGGAPGFSGTAGSGGAGADGCAGGQGGAGGGGGHGSGGAGGVEAGVLYQGSAPTHDAQTTILLSAEPAPGGEPAAAGAKEGPPGKKAAVLDAASL